MVFSSLAFLVLAVARILVPTALPDLGRWIANPHGYFHRHYALIAGAVATEVIVATLLALLGGEVSLGGQRRARSRPHDALWTLFHELNPKDSVPLVEVRTSDGTIFRGPLVAQDSGSPTADRHLVVGPPLWRHEPEGAPQQVAEGWNTVVLPLGSVEQMYVGFTPTQQQVTSPVQRRGWSKPWKAIRRPTARTGRAPGRHT